MSAKQPPPSRIANPFITQRLRLPDIEEPAAPTIVLPLPVPQAGPALGRLIALLVLFLLALALMALTAYLDRLENRAVARGPDLTPIPYTGDNPLGINVFLDKEPDRANVDRSLEMVAAGHFKWIRQTFPWSDIEIAGKGDFEDRRGPYPVVSAWAKYDYIVERANALGIQILARIDAPPDWSRPPGADIAQFPKGPPEHNQDFADFVSAVVSRYKGKITYFQLWNEPNLLGEWGGPANAREYTELLKAGYIAAKQANPDAVIVMAALAQTIEHVGDRGSENELVYLQQMYDAGAKPYFDIASTMAYGLGQSPYQRTTDLKLPGDNQRVNFSRALLFHAVMQENGDAGKAIWVSEVAWLSLPPDFGDYKQDFGPSVDEQTQARYLVEAYQRAQAEWPWMGPMFVWHLRDPDPLPNQAAPWFAILNQDFSPRAAYTALSEYGAQFPSAGTGAYTTDSPALTWDQDRGTIRFEGTRLDLVLDPGAGITAIRATLDGADLSNAIQVPASGADGGNWTVVPDWPSAQGAAARRLPMVRDLTATEHILQFSLDHANGASANPTSGVLGYVVSREDNMPWRFPAAYALLTVVLLWTAGRFSLGLSRLPTVVRSNIARPGLSGEHAATVIAATAMALALGVYYFSPFEIVALAALVIWFLLAIWRPGTALTLTAAMIPFYWVPRVLTLPLFWGPSGSMVATLSLSETCLWLTLVAWWLHRLLRPRKATVPSIRNEGVTSYLRVFSELQGPIPRREMIGSWIGRRLRPRVVADSNADVGVTGYLDLYEQLQGPVTLRQRLEAWLQRDIFGLPALVFLLVATFSLLTVANPDFLKDSLRAYRWVIVEPLLFYFLATEIMQGRRRAMRLLDGFAAGVALAALIALAQAAFDLNVLAVEQVTRIQGTFPHPNNLAIVMGRGLTLVGVTGLFLRGPAEIVRRRWYLLASLLMLPALILAFSRGAYIAVAVAFCAALLVANRRLGLTVLALGLLAAGGALLLAVLGILPERLLAEGSGLIRLDLWQSSLAMLRDHPIFGVGLDQFLNQYQDIYIFGDHQLERWLSHPHNLILDCWLSLGIIGMLAGGWIVVRYWRAALTLSRRSDPLAAAVALGAFAMLIDFLVHGMVDNSYFLQDLALIFWLACALLQLMRKSA